MARVDLAERLSGARERVTFEPGETETVAHLPKFATMTRKEALLRADQIADLAALSRILMKKRRAKRERITENTLLRIAVDLLLSVQDSLTGSSESELLESVTSEVRELRSFGLRNSDGAESDSLGTSAAARSKATDVR